MTPSPRVERGIRGAAVAGMFYPNDPDELRVLIEHQLGNVDAPRQAARAAIVPHAGLIYSGQCAAHVFRRVEIPPLVVIIGPNHRSECGHPGGAGVWKSGVFDTPLGAIRVAEDFVERLQGVCALVGHDERAHRREHCVEVELPFLAVLAPETRIAPILLAWDDWARCKELADALVDVVKEWPQDVLLLASSDMTHYESAVSAEHKDRVALAAIARLDGRELLAACREHGVTMCGRAPSAVVLEAASQLGANRADVVDYRNSGWVTGDDSDVVAYAGVVIS